MTRAAASFAAISAAEADIAGVAEQLRRRVAELDEDIAVALPALPLDEAERCLAARVRRDAALDDLCAVLGQLRTALCTAVAGGGPYAPPGWG